MDQPIALPVVLETVLPNQDLFAVDFGDTLVGSIKGREGTPDGLRYVETFVTAKEVNVERYLGVHATCLPHMEGLLCVRAGLSIRDSSFPILVLHEMLHDAIPQWHQLLSEQGHIARTPMALPQAWIDRTGYLNARQHAPTAA